VLGIKAIASLGGRGLERKKGIGVLTGKIVKRALTRHVPSWKQIRRRKRADLAGKNCDGGVCKNWSQLQKTKKS